MVRNFNIERLMDLVKDIDMVRVEEIVSRVVSAMYKGAMEAELAKARFMLKITCARIAGRQQSEYFKKVMLELNPDKNTLKRIMKYMKFLRPGITEAEITVIDVAYDNYKNTFKRVKGERKEEQGYPYSSSYFFFCLFLDDAICTTSFISGTHTIHIEGYFTKIINWNPWIIRRHDITIFINRF